MLVAQNERRESWAFGSAGGGEGGGWGVLDGLGQAVQTARKHWRLHPRRGEPGGQYKG